MQLQRKLCNCHGSALGQAGKRASLMTVSLRNHRSQRGKIDLHKEKTWQLPYFSLTGREQSESVDGISSESKIPVWENELTLKNLALAMPEGRRRREGVRGLFLFRSENSIERLCLVQKLIKDINLNF